MGKFTTSVPATRIVFRHGGDNETGEEQRQHEVTPCALDDGVA